MYLESLSQTSCLGWDLQKPKPPTNHWTALGQAWKDMEDAVNIPPGFYWQIKYTINQLGRHVSNCLELAILIENEYQPQWSEAIGKCVRN